MRPLKWSIVFVVSFLAWAVNVHASSLMPALPALQQTAITAWSSGAGFLPACGEPRYAWIPDAEMAADHPEGVDADANQETCVIRFNIKSWRSLREGDDLGALCTLVVHEIGHLYGHAHSSKGVMQAAISPDWTLVPACRRALTREHVKGVDFASGLRVVLR